MCRVEEGTGNHNDAIGDAISLLIVKRQEGALKCLIDCAAEEARNDPGYSFVDERTPPIFVPQALIGNPNYVLLFEKLPSFPIGQTGENFLKDKS